MQVSWLWLVGALLFGWIAALLAGRGGYIMGVADTLRHQRGEQTSRKQHFASDYRIAQRQVTKEVFNRVTDNMRSRAPKREEHL